MRCILHETNLVTFRMFQVYLFLKGSVTREEAVSQVVHWFKIIVQRRLLPFLRNIDWIALWQRVRTNVAEFLRAGVPAVSLYFGRHGYKLGFCFIAVGLAIIVRTAFSRRALTLSLALPFRSTT